MKYAVKIFYVEEMVGIDELTSKNVEKASRHLLRLKRGDDETKFKFKMKGNYGALLYRNDSESMEQINVSFTELITLKSE